MLQSPSRGIVAPVTREESSEAIDALPYVDAMTASIGVLV
jgi:hypothetical protein